ncbi:hypothetical protein A2331_06925 [Candidatus Falkowbacteria bacterium RIFOXYB2_FULL_34_18]|uniref:Diacylglycerol kinase n=1 Tax=Candidatus Falkowbacteria bacterium RIFOXYD2_FULL_34_120 TaxID=1798007 RepID=A0A1F5TRF7_9BACT|nr:MAG: hypothetical protein A2331_06925 [Candidatus Falkowbacteria bacterium RIFOXYB2_FULL_34_18]OGF29945.1 MAG: hypothetical protein A2500_03750 [Candidatus Falkowbacteria bacterium RIFOXYC12_FULL_34_55]OGF37197.1 MAG: hypothetical protein A2466_02765 [Candidatus Falkowbacteria bacterium RIFOXYC2_FULL_34_220]OGF39483.1 MAG: hypothetical protein A2515_04125 [Candidatus Falkowbacteria bacterium RIFOXYD12_FULL_34_57]OGF41535.1 MAG: hypothetical protein A2531_02480 [Candidatus Falkowbacteria bact
MKSFQYAFRGLLKIFNEEQNLKVHLLITLAVLIFGFIFHVSRFDWIILILIISLVFLMEIINSAVERVSDALKPRIDNYVKEIKDISAAAVMFASIIAILVGVLIFYPYITH